jgi:hypothetical protein
MIAEGAQGEESCDGCRAREADNGTKDDDDCI